MKVSAVTSCTTAAIILIATVGSGSAAPKNCEDILADNLYRCHVKQEGGAEFDNCTQFVSAGGLSSKFDLVADGLFTFGCTCKAKGSFKKPKFDASRTFFCTSSAVGEGIQGTVSGNGKKIKGGFVASQDGFSVIFECELDPSCAPPL